MDKTRSVHHKFDPQRYHAQYANSPKGTGLNTFEDKDLRYWRWNEDKSLIICAHDGEIFLEMSPWAGERIILYDPSRAENRGSSMQAILVLLKGYPLPYRIVLEAHVSHYPADEAIELLFKLNEKWRPSLVSVEHRGFQGAIKNWMHEKSERENRPMPPVLLWPPKGSPTATWAKEEHIKACQPLAHANLIWLHETQTELKDEFEFHPNVRYQDGVDCFSQSLDYWPAMISEVEATEDVKTERDHLAMILGLDTFAHEEEPWDEMKWLKSVHAPDLGPTLN